MQSLCPSLYKYECWRACMYCHVFIIVTNNISEWLNDNQEFVCHMSYDSGTRNKNPHNWPRIPNDDSLENDSNDFY